MEDEASGSMCVCVSEATKIYPSCRVGRFFMALGATAPYLAAVSCSGSGINHFLIQSFRKSGFGSIF